MCDASDNELLADLLVTLDGDDYGPLELMEVERAVAPAPGPSQNFSCASSDVPTPSVGGATDTDAPLSPYAPSTDFAATLISALEPLTGVLYSETQLHDRGDYGGIVVEPPAIDLQDDTESETATTAAPSAPDVLPGKNYGPKHKSDPNKARKAQSEQIRALRSEVEELTERLSTLQAVSRRDGAGMETLQNKANAQAAGKRLDAPPVWESICHNQRTRRTEVEQDNSLLKRALDEQAQLVDDLQRALQRSSKALVRLVFAISIAEFVYFSNAQHELHCSIALSASVEEHRRLWHLFAAHVCATLQLGHRCQDLRQAAR